MQEDSMNNYFYYYCASHTDSVGWKHVKISSILILLSMSHFYPYLCNMCAFKLNYILSLNILLIRLRILNLLSIHYSHTKFNNNERKNLTEKIIPSQAS